MSAPESHRGARPSPLLLTLALLGVVSGIAFLVLRDEGPLLARALTKPVPIFAMAVWVALRGRAPLRGLVVAGLLASAAGDLVLLGDGDGAFVGGLLCFLVGHLLYVAAFVREVRTPRLLRAIPFFAFGGAVFAVLLPGLGGMLPPVAAYCLVISVMGWRAAARVGDTPGPVWLAWVGVAGASSFIVSDSLIALDAFHSPIPHVGYAIMVTYYLGQLGIAWSAAGPQLRSKSIS